MRSVLNAEAKLRWAALSLVIGCCLSVQTSSGQDNRRSGVKIEALPHSLEVKLALSAAPPYLRSEAAVYVLDSAKGYVPERKGTNGFTCYVERTDYLREGFTNDFIVPECQDAEGSRTIVPVEFDVERLRAEGMTPPELKMEIERRFKEGKYHAPARTGVAYMLSPIARLYTGPNSRTTATINMPHYMFFAPNLTEKDFGGGPPMSPYPYLINPGPMSYIILEAGGDQRSQINRDS